MSDDEKKGASSDVLSDAELFEWAAGTPIALASLRRVHAVLRVPTPFPEGAQEHVTWMIAGLAYAMLTLAPSQALACDSIRIIIEGMAHDLKVSPSRLLAEFLELATAKEGPPKPSSRIVLS